MKMKRWLSRGIVLAMIVAMMVPMPVAAKSSKSSKNSGKLVKSVTYYDYNYGKDEKYGTADDKYDLEYKLNYTYDKKGNPTQIKRTDYEDFFLTIPTSATVQTQNLKYKYKGKNVKSMTMTNDAGFVKQTRTYSGGKVASYSGNSYVETWSDDKEYSRKYNGSLAYNKAGNVTGTCCVYGYTWANEFAGYDEFNTQYYLLTQKGLPTYRYATLTNYKETKADGSVVTEDYSAEGGYYATYTNKGFLTQEGFYDAKAAKYNANLTYQYVMNKGLVKEAILFYVNEDGKEVAIGKYVFDYNKTKISAQRFMNMINSFVVGNFYGEAYGLDEGDEYDYMSRVMMYAWY